MKTPLSLLATVLASLLLSACVQAQTPDGTSASTPASAASTVSKALASSGITISGELDAPKGYFGFIGNYQGRQLPVYLLPDGKHIAIGTLVDTHGRDLTSAAMRTASETRLSETNWQMLSKADWIVEGNPQAKRIVYVFADTRCPYCHHFWKNYQPFLASGKVQVRNIVVAVISPDSLPEAALLLDAKDPAAAWSKLEGNFGHNPKPDPKAGSASARLKIVSHNALMQQLGFFGTPAIIYKDADGKIHSLSGMPRESEVMKAIFGP